MRKAISPVVSTILLLVMTISAAALAFLWFNVIQGDIQESTGAALEGSSFSDCSRIRLLAIRGNGVTVQNTGCDDVSSVKILINGVLTDYDLDSPLSPGQTVTINYANQPAGEDLCVEGVLGNAQSDTLCSYAYQNTEEAGFGEYCVDEFDCDDDNPCTSNNCISNICSYSDLVNGNYTGCSFSSGCSGSGNVFCACVSGSCIDTCGNSVCDSWESVSSCVEDCGCQELQGSCSLPNVWFTGDVTAENKDYCACCGDDGVNDNFYNGSISSTNSFCYNAFTTFQSIDSNQTLCEYYGYDWLIATGYYAGSYSFDNETLNSVPSGWTVRVPDVYGHVLIKDYTTHSRVLEIRDSDGSNYYSATKTFNSNGSVGSVEFYFEFNAPYAGGATYIKILGVEDHIQLRIMGGGILRETNSSSNSLRTVSEGTWYHAKVDFDVDLGWNIQINGVNYGGSYTFPFYNGKSPESISGISFASGLAVNPTAAHEYQRFDAISFSWDPNYSTGQNLYENKCCGDDDIYDNFTNGTNTCTNGVFS